MRWSRPSPSRGAIGSAPGSDPDNSDCQFGAALGLPVDLIACEREPLGPTGCRAFDRPKVIDQFNAPTAREMIMTAMTNEMADCTIISILAHSVTGKLSVGLKAVALVKAR